MTPANVKDDERLETTIIGAAVAFALIVALGLSGWKVGLLDSIMGGSGPVQVAAGILTVVKAQADGSPEKALLSGIVGTDAESAGIEAALRKALPGTEVKNALRADERAKDVKKSIVRISLAADAIAEAWPRPRFGDVKRLELLWKEERLTVRGATFAPAARVALETAFAKIGEANRGAIQIRDVVRSAVSAVDLQQNLSSTLANRSITFVEADATIKMADDAAAAAIIADLAPLLRDLKGIEVLVAAGHLDRATAMKQAEAVTAALVAAGADASGLRPVPAPKNNLLALIVREKE